MKQMMVWLLALTFFCGGMLTAVAEDNLPADTELIQRELQRAVDFGFGISTDEYRAATYAEFMTMLDRAVELADAAQLPGWQAKFGKARMSAQVITRFNAMALTAAAQIELGADYVRINSTRENPEGFGNEWERCIVDEEVLGDLSFLVPPASGLEENPEIYDWNGEVIAYFITFNRESMFSNQPLFDFDETIQSRRPDEALTYSEAMLAALRLHDSGLSGERYLTPADLEIIAKADARRAAILSSPTAVKVKDKKYYVSNSGDDSHNGLSPETAWATIDKVNAAKLKQGDGLFFNRGDLWRDAMLFCQKGVTYSAYGEGEKPCFYGSPENGASPDYWALVDGYENIWVYRMDMQEVGMILCDDDTILLDKYVAFWDVDRQRFVVSLDMQTPFSLDLLTNKQFFCDIDLRGLEGGQLGLGSLTEAQGATSFTQNGSSLALWSANVKGKLYLRCDEGNPGSLYRSMEFGKSPYTEAGDGGVVIQVAEKATLDNLCVKYASNTALNVRAGCTIQNCEISFIGGGALVYTPLDKYPGAPQTLRDLVCADDGVAMTFDHPSNVSITHNYIHDNLNTPCNLEHYLDGAYENIRINGNLLERNGNAFCMTNFFPSDDPHAIRYKNITIDDNYAMYTGYGFDRGLHGHLYPLHTYGFFSANQYKNVKYTNNVFYLTKGAFFCLNDNATLDAFEFSGNTYVHNNGGILLWDTTNGFLRLNYDSNARQTVVDITGDETAVVLLQSFASAP